MDKDEAIRRIRADARPVAPEQDYTVEVFSPKDAPGVARLFHEIYGESYPVADYYIPEKIIAANQAGNLRSAVARLASGDVAGHGALYRGAPQNPRLFEFGLMLILPEYRNSFIAYRLGRLITGSMALAPDIDGIFGEAVCHITTTQKMSSLAGLRPCALEMAVMPEGAYAREGAPGRVSCLVTARTLRGGRWPVYAWDRHREPVTRIVAELDLARDLAWEINEPSPGSITDCRVTVYGLASLVRFQVPVLGMDFAECLLRLEARIAREKLEVAQVYLNAADPAAAWACSLLARHGFYFGGLIPLWFGPDALLLQRQAKPPDFGACVLHGQSAKELMTEVMADYTCLARPTPCLG